MFHDVNNVKINNRWKVCQFQLLIKRYIEDVNILKGNNLSLKYNIIFQSSYVNVHIFMKKHNPFKPRLFVGICVGG